MSVRLRGLVLTLAIALLLPPAASLRAEGGGQGSGDEQGKAAAGSMALMADAGELPGLTGARLAAAKKIDPGLKAPVLYWELQDQEVHIYRRNIEGLAWRQVRETRQRRRDARQSPKLLRLNYAGLTALFDGSKPLQSNLIGRVHLFVRDPNGKIERLAPMKSADKPASVPSGEKMNGRYILSARLELDQTQNGLSRRLFLYAKHFVTHYEQDLSSGSRPDVFFNDQGKVAFEIGPVVNNAKSKYSGAMQRPHRSYVMMVKYNNKPLPGCKVVVCAEGGAWQGRYITNGKGVFTITPTDDRAMPKTWQRYLYIAEHFDAEEDSYHIATLPVIISKNRPEWRSKEMGLWFWAITGSAICLLLVAGIAWRKRRQDKRSLVVFENCRVKKE